MISVESIGFVESVRGQSVTEAGMSFTVGRAAGELERYVSDNIIGLHGFFASRKSSRSPFVFGSEVGIELYESEQSTELVGPEGSSTPAEVVLSDNMAVWHLFVRIQPPGGFARPYLETFLGPKLFFSSRTVRAVDQGGLNAQTTTIKVSNIGASYGLGTGIALNIFNGLLDDYHGNLSVVLGIRYLLGAEAEFLVPPLENIHPNDRTDPGTQSRSHILETRIGFSVSV